jgi:glycyl-tRNA synthetase
MFTNFRNVLNTSRKKVPFGIAQVGKVFRNEITPGNFIFRTLEFDLMEFEYFIQADKWEETFDYWLKKMHEWVDYIGLDSSRTRVREHSKDELSHYSTKTVDIEFNTPFGWKELYGLAYRTDFDLKNHMEKSGVDMSYLDPYTNEKFIPHVIEPTFGLSRTVLMTMLSAYHEEEVDGENRVVMKFDRKIAPYTVAVLPLVNKLNDKAMEIVEIVQQHFNTDYDTSGSIGRRYRRQDEIGTPYCLTVDFDTIEKDGCVTVRDRDTMKQERIKIENIVGYISDQLK